MTITKQMYIGKSLSMCVKDILIGNVKLDEVLRIESGTKIDTIIELVELTIDYYDRYWKDIKEVCLSDCYNIVNHLIFHNKLHQERVIKDINGHLERSIELHHKVRMSSNTTGRSNGDNWWEVIEVELISHPSTEPEEWKAKVGIRVVEEINE